MKKSLLKIVLLMMIMSVHLAGITQKQDNQSLLRDFVQISNNYQRRPVDLQIAMSSRTNFLMDQMDTIQMAGEFYLRDNAGYIRFGQVEQIVNDSMAVLVNDELQEMIVYRNANKIIEFMKKRVQFAMPDSSIQKLQERYVVESVQQGDESLIRLKSRMLIDSTQMPRETIELLYDAKTKMPKQVSIMRRSLLPLDMYEAALTTVDPARTLVNIGGHVFFVREQSTAIVYKKLVQPASGEVPVKPEDRIARTVDGGFAPTANYKDYRLVNGQ